MSEQETFKKIATIISLLTGVPEDELLADAVLDEDLGIDFRQELPAIIAYINSEFDIELDPPFVLLSLGDDLSMNNFVTFIHEEAEL